MGPRVADLMVGSVDEAKRLAHVVQQLRSLNGGQPQLSIVDASSRPSPKNATEVLVLPGAARMIPNSAQAVTRCVVGESDEPVIVVPGAGELDSQGQYVLSASAGA
ncbi:MAG: hypothetical protein ABIZ50_01255, partial [Solirubrobacterales bacterium]